MCNFSTIVWLENAVQLSCSVANIVLFGLHQLYLIKTLANVCNFSFACCASRKRLFVRIQTLPLLTYRWRDIIPNASHSLADRWRDINLIKFGSINYRPLK